MSDKSLPAYLAPTFAERKAAREGTKVEPKQVDVETDEVEDKAIGTQAVSRKAPARKKA